MHYRPEIDGLRALAVVPVILFHAGVSGFSGGFVGVDIFFVISGYLITTIIMQEIKVGKFSLVNFYERRARRIFPALFLVLFCSLPFAWLWLVPQDFKSLSQSLVAVCLFSSNMLFWQTSGYFGSTGELTPLLHTWSLAVEEQFYMVFPLFLILIWRLWPRRLLPVLLLCTIASLGLAEWGSSAEPNAAFYLLPARSWELMMGAFAAIFLLNETGHRKNDTVCQTGSIAGLLLLLYGIFVFDEHVPFPSLYTLVPTLGTTLVILFATPSTIVGKLLSQPLLVGIGLISFSAYLWHQPLFAFARHRSLDEPSSQVFAGLALLSGVLAYFSWRFVEKPFRDRARFGRGQIFALGAGCTVVLLAIGIAGHFTHGFKKERTTEAHRQVLDTAVASPMRRECHGEPMAHPHPADACEYFDGKLRVAVFGDSHAVELAYSMAQGLKDRKIGVKQFTLSGCGPTYGRNLIGPDEDCANWSREAVEYISNDPQLDYVVVTYRIHSALFGSHERSYPGWPDNIGSAERELRWGAYVGVLRHFLDHGKKVTLVLQAPELPKQVDALIVRATDPKHKVDGASRAWWDQRSAWVRSHLQQLPDGVQVIDPTTLFCDKVSCAAAKDGRALYFDDDHMSVEGAAQVAAEVLKTMTF